MKYSSCEDTTKWKQTIFILSEMDTSFNSDVYHIILHIFSPFYMTSLIENREETHVDNSICEEND